MKTYEEAIKEAAEAIKFMEADEFRTSEDVHEFTNHAAAAIAALYSDEAAYVRRNIRAALETL